MQVRRVMAEAIENAAAAADFKRRFAAPNAISMREIMEAEVLTPAQRRAMENEPVGGATGTTLSVEVDVDAELLHGGDQAAIAQIVAKKLTAAGHRAEAVGRHISIGHRVHGRAFVDVIVDEMADADAIRNKCGGKDSALDRLRARDDGAVLLADPHLFSRLGGAVVPPARTGGTRAERRAAERAQRRSEWRAARGLK